MPLDMNWFRSLPEKEQRILIEKLENSHRIERKNLENIEKMCNTYLADDKNSARDIAAILDHRKSVREEIKNIEDDMSKISSYMYDHHHGHGHHHHHKGRGRWRTCRLDSNAVAAVKSIVRSGGVNIRPGEFHQSAAGILKPYKTVLEDRITNRDAAERSRLAALLNELNRPAKKEDPQEKKEEGEKE